MFKFDLYNGDNKFFQNFFLKFGDFCNVFFFVFNWVILCYDVFLNWYLFNGIYYEIIENIKSLDVIFVFFYKIFVEFMRGILNDVMGIFLILFERYRGYNFIDLDSIKSFILLIFFKQMIGNKIIIIDKRWRID